MLHQQAETPPPEYASVETGHMHEMPASREYEQGPPSMAPRGDIGSGTNVVGNPTTPTHLSGNQPAVGGTTSYTENQPLERDTTSYTDSTATAPSATTSAYTFPQSAHASPAPPASMPSYVQTSSAPANAAKTPMDSIMHVFNKWSKKAEDYTGNVWNHLKTGPNIADTAWGRLSVGTKAMTEGGLENLFRQNFDVLTDEHLLRTYACYLSTSTGPVAGTLYISSHKLAFCSDRPLAIPKSPVSNNGQATTPPPVSSKATTGRRENATEQQQEWCFYKVSVPITHLQSVTPTENTQKKVAEKYVQVKTVDGHEFWFMGFVNYDKGVKNLQETLLSKSTAGPTYEDNSAMPSRTGTGASTTGPTSTYENNGEMPGSTAGRPYDESRTMPGAASAPAPSASMQHLYRHP